MSGSNCRGFPPWPFRYCVQNSSKARIMVRAPPALAPSQSLRKVVRLGVLLMLRSTSRSGSCKSSSCWSLTRMMAGFGSENCQGPGKLSADSGGGVPWAPRAPQASGSVETAIPSPATRWRNDLRDSVIMSPSMLYAGTEVTAPRTPQSRTRNRTRRTGQTDQTGRTDQTNIMRALSPQPCRGGIRCCCRSS